MAGGDPVVAERTVVLGRQRLEKCLHLRRQRVVSGIHAGEQRIAPAVRWNDFLIEDRTHRRDIDAALVGVPVFAGDALRLLVEMLAAHLREASIFCEAVPSPPACTCSGPKYFASRMCWSKSIGWLRKKITPYRNSASYTSCTCRLLSGFVRSMFPISAPMQGVDGVAVIVSNSIDVSLIGTASPAVPLRRP